MHKTGTENHTENASTSEMTHNQKYRGLIKRSIFKDFRDNLFRYFDYLYTMAPSNRFISNIFRTIIFIQQCVLAFSPFNRVLWPPDSLLGRIMSVFSVVAFICPFSVDSQTHFIVTLIIYIIMFFYYILFFSNLEIFLKMSKVHSVLVAIISVYLNVLQPYLINLVSSHLGCDLYYIIEDDQRAPHIITFILGMLYMSLLVFIQTLFVAPSITFRPQVIHIMYSRYSMIYCFCSIAMFFFATLGGCFDGIAGLILSIIPAIPSGIILFISFKQYIWAYIPSMILHQAFSTLFCVFTILLPILGYLEIEGSEIMILGFVIVMIVLHFVFQKISDAQFKKNSALLDEVANDEEQIYNLSYNTILSLLRYGFDNGHPLCHTWRLFDVSLEKYEKDYAIILMYARYAAIYSDESATLHKILRILKQMKHGSIELKHVLFQINSLLQHRERGLSKALKKTLSKIQDKTEKCRGTMRYTWECVIRGNVVDLENLSTQLKRNEDEILREYNQLCLVYPNNPYVQSAYSAFLLDIMCNEKEATEVQKVYRLLRTGARTRIERSYYFAIRHIPTLPNEETHTSMTRIEKTTAMNDTHSYASSVAAMGMIGDLTENNSEEKTQRRYIESMVNSVRLPTTRYGPILIIFAIALLMPILIVVILIVVIMKMENNGNALDIMEAVSLVNLYMAHTSLLTWQWVMSTPAYTKNATGQIIRLKPQYLYTLKEKFEHLYGDIEPDKKPNFFVDSDKEAVQRTAEDLRYQLNQINKEMPNLASSGYFDDALEYLFSDKLSTRNSNSPSTYHVIDVSIEHVVTYTAATAIQVVSSSLLASYQAFLTNGYWTILKNAPYFYLQYEEFEKIMIADMQNMLDSSTTYTTSIVVGILIPGFAISLALIIFLTIRMENEKRQLFRSFKALPKSAVSAIVQQLNAQSGKDNTEEAEQNVASTGNVQEENALRVLSTSVDHGFGWIGRSWKIIVVLILFAICCIVAIVLLSIIPVRSTNTLIKLTPLYHDISTIHTLIAAAITAMHRISIYYPKEKNDMPNFQNFYIKNIITTNEIFLVEENTSALFELASGLTNSIIEKAHVLRFGDESTQSEGISLVGYDLIELLSGHKETNLVIPEEDIQILEICSYDSQISWIDKMMENMLLNMRTKEDTNYSYYNLNNDKYTLAYMWLLGNSYTDYILPSFQALKDHINYVSTSSHSMTLIVPIIILAVIIVICGIILVPIYQKIGETAQWTLRLLLFCEPNVVLQSKVILKILSNDFSADETDENEEKSNFYESVVSHLLDGVIFMSNDLVIRSANHAVLNVIGKDPNDVIGMSLKDIFTAPPDQESSLRSFYQAVDGAMNCMRSPSIEAEVEVLKDNEPVTLLLSLTAISATGEVQIKPINAEGLAILVLSMKDMTSTIVARTLLQEENAKNENLLTMILPPVIVKQLQRGEHNICFSVQSASIVFMDIVSFTPWCGSHPAVYIMSTLNRLFLEFDSILKQLDRMTKIKCIGDCYMCAGGIFDEVNQPSEHAKQAITFGLDAIKGIERVNGELNESLRIRVGCNTGGPIVAGVLGIEKPTFDILGPDINLAAMMEHHGVPMNVHIPQHVYDLVYGDYFVIKERGDVDVKGKMYHTYIVTGYGHNH